MTAAEFTALLVLTTAASFTPGPNTTLSTALAANLGLRRALRFVVAVPVGWGLLFTLCAGGVGAMVVAMSLLGQWALEELELPPQPLLHLSFQDPQAHAKIRGRITIWTPPPECGRQVINTFLRSWVQSPGDTSGIFIIPCIMQRQWGRVSKSVQERGVYHAGLLPDPYRFQAHLPFVLLYVPTHTPTMRRDRMELPAPAQPKGWHKHQAEQVRGLS